MNESRRFGPLSEYNSDELSCLIDLLSGGIVVKQAFPGDADKRLLQVMILGPALQENVVAEVEAPFNVPVFGAEFRGKVYDLLVQVVALIDGVTIEDDWLIDTRTLAATEITILGDHVRELRRTFHAEVDGITKFYAAVAILGDEPGVVYVNILGGCRIPENRIVTDSLERGLDVAVGQFCTWLLSHERRFELGK